MHRTAAATLACITLVFTALQAQTSSPETPRTEDWATISLAKSGLPLNATGGVLLSKTELPECTRELLRLQWRPHDPIDLYVIRPRGIEKPPAALYLLNYTFDSDIFRGDGWCKQAKQNGLAVVGFASALSGQRFHSPRPLKEWFVSDLQEALAASAHDVQMVLNYLGTRDDLDLKRIGMFGEGSGASIAILATAADPNSNPKIVALDVSDPWADWPNWLKNSKQIPEDERAIYLKPEFLQKVASLDPATYLPQLQLKSLRIEQVMNDPFTPPGVSDKIAEIAPKSAQVVRFQNVLAQKEAWGPNGLSGWLAEQLHSRVPGLLEK